MATEHNRAKGDIRDLYAYYRFTDHEMTNITLKDTALSKEPVWFEGHMNWTFVKCSFVEEFYFGVSGSRLEEDTRGTTENEEPFPPYGSNGLNFTDCMMTKPFEIKDNCVAVFVRCTFTDTLTIEDNCKAEFIECTFTKGITLSTYCDIRFIRCELNMSDFGMVVEEHCNLELHNCTHGNVDEDWFRLSVDCTLLLRSDEDAVISAVKNTFWLDDYCTGKVYGYDILISEEQDVVKLEANSKFEIRDATTVIAQQKNTFEITDSELFLREVCNCIAQETGHVVLASGSLIRAKNVETWTSVINDTINVTDIKMYVDRFDTIHSDKGHAIYANNSELKFKGRTPQCGESGVTITSAQNIAILIEAGADAYFEEVDLVESAQRDTVKMTTGSWGKFKDTVLIDSPQSIALVLEDSRYTDNDGTKRCGKISAVKGTNSTIEVYNVPEFSCPDEICLDFTNCLYDMREILIIKGKFVGFYGANCKGILTYIGDVTAEINAVILLGCSGPTEWDTISLISSKEDAWVVSGNLQLRVSKVNLITSEEMRAVVWNQTAGDSYISEIQRIEAFTDVAADFTIAGKFRAEDIPIITSEEETALKVTVISGEAEFQRVDTVIAPLKDAMVVNISAGASLYYDEFNDITSELGKALTGTCSGVGLFANGVIITSQMEVAVNITGSGAQSRFKFADIGTISSQEPPDDMCEISGVSFVQLHRVGEFTADQSSRYVLYLRGPGENYGRAEVIDCPDINGNKVRGGVYIQRFGWTEFICSAEKGSVSIQEAEAIVVGLAHTSGRVANFTEFKDSGEKGRGLYSYGLGTSKSSLKFENIDLIEGGLRGAQFYCDGNIELHNIKEIKGPLAPEDAKGLEFDGEGTLTITGGSQATVISSKDNDSDAILLNKGTHTLTRVDTEASKGSIPVLDNNKTSFHNCTLKGTIQLTNSFVEFFNTETTSGYDLDAATVEWVKSTINIGQDDGVKKDFLSHKCACRLIQCVVTGSEDMDFDDTNTFMQDVDGGGFSGELTFQRATILMSAEFANASLTNLNEAAVILNSGFGDTGLVGGMISANSAYKVVDAGEGLISTADQMDELTLDDATGVILNAGSIDGALDIGANSALLINLGTVTGAVTLGANDAVMGNALNVAGGAVTLGSENAFMGNLLTLTDALTTGVDCGVMLCKADIGAALEIKSSSGAIVAKGDAASLDINAATSFIGSAVDAVPTTHDGSAVLVGANAQLDGTGQGLVITDGTFGRVDDDDGTSGLRTGIMMDSEVIHLFNEYGHTGAAGTGCSMILGAKATGYAVSPQWLPSATDMVRSGVLIYDLATEIHHNLPEEDIPD